MIGVRLVPMLIAAGHEVAGMTRSAGKADGLRDLGATPVVCDVFDADTLVATVSAFRPELVMHQLTDLPDTREQIPEYSERNNRIRTEGTRNLLAASAAAEARRCIAQSIAWSSEATDAAVAEHERLILAADGIVVRYGIFYGPGTYSGTERVPPPPRIEIDAAARRTIELLDAPSGVVTIVDDD